MKITINNKTLDLNFGIRFVYECRKKNKQVVNLAGFEQTLEIGLQNYIERLFKYDTVALIEVIECALWKHKDEFKTEDLYDWFDNPDTNVDELFAKVMEKLEESNATKKEVKTMKEQVKNQQKEAIELQKMLTKE